MDILQVDKVKEVVGSGKKENDAMPPQSRKTKKKSIKITGEMMYRFFFIKKKPPSYSFLL